MNMTKQDISQKNLRAMIAALELAMKIAKTESKRHCHYNHDFGYVAKDIADILSSDGGECGVKNWCEKTVGKEYTTRNYDYKEAQP